MAQVGSIKLVGAADIIAHPSQPQQPREDATESFENSNNREIPSRTEERIPEVDTMDDEVQLVLSVPRRRRKKRKRFMFSHSPLGQYQDTQTFPRELPKDENKSMECSARRKSTSVVHRLESCHIGDKEAGFRRGSLPAAPMSINSPLQEVSWSPEPGYISNQSPQFSPFTVPLPWWDEPTSPLPHIPLSSSNWGPWQLEDVAPKKRKYEDRWQDGAPPRKQYRSSTQISPRTNPVSMTSSARYNSPQPSPGSASTYERLMSDHSINTTWPSFDWEPYRVVNPQYVSPYAQSSIPMDITDSNPSSVSQQRPSFQDWPQQTMQFQQDFDSTQRNCTMLSPSQNSSQTSMVASGFSVQPQPAPASSIRQTFLRSPTQPLPASSAARTTPVPSPNGGIRQATTCTSTEQALNALANPRPPVRIPEASDIIRKPSLYAIPAWPAASSVSAPKPASSTRVPPLASVNSTTTTQSVPATPTVPPSPSIVQIQRPASNASTVPRVNGSLSPSPSTSASTSTPTLRNQSPTPRTSSEEFQIPRARAGRKHSPNIIVDIAETCQEVFPFGVVAERHNVPIQKVFDTFSAIVQLPLLRNADDRRRHGSLGKRRMKEYRDAKKAMEKAHEAERKAEMRAMRARVDEAAKKGQNQGQGHANGNGKGLLKAAILNNAGKNQGCGE
ncbi:hypothetical protein EG329_001408 [Mollisiaceae sp. DMI_Dod_QoI]|nr:hypothetical protein EG329_001408 [Helotiales sp. DMI_Dod_QoI]